MQLFLVREKRDSSQSKDQLGSLHQPHRVPNAGQDGEGQEEDSSISHPLPSRPSPPHLPSSDSDTVTSELPAAAEEGESHSWLTTDQTTDAITSSNLNRNNTETTSSGRPQTPSAPVPSRDAPSTSPRKSLSLRKRRNSDLPSDGLKVADNLGHKSRTREDGRTGEMTAGRISGREETRPAFVLGARENCEEEAAESSQFELPVVSIPGNSQFEPTEESQQMLQLEPPATGEPAPQGSSIFSNVGVSKRVPRVVQSGKTVREGGREMGVSDPFEFDSESHNTEVKFVRKRRRHTSEREGEGQGEGEGEGEEEGEGEGEGEGEDRGMKGGAYVTPVFIGGGEGEGEGGVHISGQELTPNQRNGQSTSHTTSPQTVPNEATVATRLHPAQPKPSEAALSSSPPPLLSTPPVLTTTTQSSPHPHLSTPSHPPPSTNHTIIGPYPSTPLISTPHTPTTTPTSSTLHLFTQPHLLSFTLPNAKLSPQCLRECTSHYQASGHRYSLRHVRTDLVEVKTISEVVFEGDKMVEGMSRVWQVRLHACNSYSHV